MYCSPDLCRPHSEAYPHLGDMCDLHPKQIEAYRRMTPTEKWAVAVQLQQTARACKAAFLREKHLDWLEEQIQAKVRELFLYATTD